MVAKRNYSILARLGQGAHGSVLMARNLEVIYQDDIRSKLA